MTRRRWRARRRARRRGIDAGIDAGYDGQTAWGTGCMMSARKGTRRPPIRWVLLDRDGTINVKPPRGEYVTAAKQLELLPYAAKAIRLLNDARVWTAVVTNQRGIARGEMTERDLQAVHARLLDQLARHGAHLDAIYHCPHELGVCSCRKPQPGLLLRAQREHPGLSFTGTAIVGDEESDVEAGRRAGAGTVLLARDHASGDHGADHVAGTLLDAVEWLRTERGLAESFQAG
jgi:D-glycero-D-manno-heptose 1,7-bisphosphate phosphatase